MVTDWDAQPSAFFERNNMSNHKFEIIIHASALLAITIFFNAFLNLNYPYVGHDYGYVVPHLMDTDIHYKINGLSIQWYTPSWGGGLPAYPNPEHIQFSLPQFLTLILDPWTASIISTVVFILIGYFAMYFFIVRIMGLQWRAGVLGALFFTINGFYIEHTVVGHIGFQTFPLLPVITLALFSASLPVTISAIVISFVMTIVIHQSGFYIFVVFLLSLAVALPVLYLVNAKVFNFKRMLIVTLLAALFFILLSGSKIYAVYSFMRFFPRYVSDNFPITTFQGLIGMVKQYVGVMGLAPLRLLRGRDINALRSYYSIVFNHEYGVWEYDISLTPILWIFLSVGFLFHFFPKEHIPTRPVFHPGRWLAGGLLILATWLVIEFTLAKGILYPALQDLPILSSLHVNVRFASALIYPLAILGAYSSEAVFSKFKFLTKPITFSLITFFTLAPMLFYFSFSKDLWNRNFNISQSMHTFQLIQEAKILPVDTIVQLKKNLNLLESSSNLSIYEPIFGYNLDNFHPEVHPGSVFQIQDEYLNMTNPAGFVFPEENQTRPFERIPATDISRLQEFINHRQPDWNRPLLQSVLDLTAEISASSFILVLVFFLMKGAVTFLKKNR
jgi:hypothetical protein